MPAYCLKCLQVCRIFVEPRALIYLLNKSTSADWLSIRDPRDALEKTLRSAGTFDQHSFELNILAVGYVVLLVERGYKIVAEVATHIVGGTYVDVFPLKVFQGALSRGDLRQYLQMAVFQRVCSFEHALRIR